MRSRGPRLLALATVAAFVAAVSASGSQSRSLKGGTYRVGWEYSFEGDGFDPTGEDQYGVYGIYSNLLIRTLVGYDHVPGVAGTKLVPDLATSVPTPTNGGRTYTFTLKRGVRFGPPVNRDVTSGDIRYAIERLARPKNHSWFATYFTGIRGFDAYRAGRARSISGIATPSSRTIVFTLTRPDGGFPHLLAMPAAGPIPQEVAKCFEGKPGKYGSDLVSSGPYMIQGADKVRLGSCAAIRPMTGISSTQLTLVRNPRYDPETDTRAARENNPDRFVFVAYQRGGLAHNVTRIVQQLEAGGLDDSFFTSFPKALRAAANAARARGLLRLNSANWPVFVMLNLTRPPFDDVHVRRALAWVLDRAAMRDAVGGPLVGELAGHIVPDVLLGNRLQGFDPFSTPGEHGSLAKARAEMAKSRYATRNGVCVARACKHVFFSPLFDTPLYSAGTRMTPIVEKAAQSLGITLVKHGREFDRLFTPSNDISLAPNVDWTSDFADAATFVDRQFSGRRIDPKQNFDFSLVGITPTQATRLGVKGDVKGAPSVDRDIAKCSALGGSPRLDCYAQLDRKLTTDVVPWIPLVWRNRITILGSQVAKWQFDQASGTTAFAHVAVKT